MVNKTSWRKNNTSGAKEKNIKHIFNRTDFWGGGNHVSSIDVWGRCNDRIALGQTFFCCKKHLQYSNFETLPLPPPQKKKTTCRFCCFCVQPISTTSTKKSTPPVSRFSFLLFSNAPGLKLNTKLNAQIGWVPWTQIGQVGQKISEGSTYVPSGKWRHEGLEPDIFVVTLILEKRR